jgi:formiminotetrahydrofolate cyclodeaminase
MLDKEEDEAEHKLISESANTVNSQRGKKDKKKVVSFNLIPKTLKEEHLTKDQRDAKTRELEEALKEAYIHPWIQIKHMID